MRLFFDDEMIVPVSTGVVRSMSALSVRLSVSVPLPVRLYMLQGWKHILSSTS